MLFVYPPSTLSDRAVTDCASRCVQEAKKIDFAGNKVHFTTSAGVETSESYNHLIVATGGVPNRLPVEGGKLDNIFVMRGIADTSLIDAGQSLSLAPEDHKLTIIAALGDANDKKVVVVGSSFIGMESALACSKRSASVSVIGMESVPFEKILGKEVGVGIQKYHEAQSTKFYLDAALSHFVPSDTNPKAVGGVAMKDGSVIPCDVVVLGVGVKPATALLKESGVELERDSSVVVDAHLRIKSVNNNVFAIGDIAKFPDGLTGELTRVEHWNVASVSLSSLPTRTAD